MECPKCSTPLRASALSCPQCGAVLPADIQLAGRGQAGLDSAPERKWNPWIAGLLSLVLPGAGQVYRGYWFRGLVWLCFVVLGYLFYFFPGLCFHIGCVMAAVSGNPYIER